MIQDESNTSYRSASKEKPKEKKNLERCLNITSILLYMKSKQPTIINEMSFLKSNNEHFLIHISSTDMLMEAQNIPDRSKAISVTMDFKMVQEAIRYDGNKF